MRLQRQISKLSEELSQLGNATMLVPVCNLEKHVVMEIQIKWKFGRMRNDVRT